MILAGQRHPALLVGISAVAIVLFVEYIRRFQSAFRPLTFFAVDSNTLLNIFNSQGAQRVFTGEAATQGDGDETNEQDPEKQRVAKLQSSLLFNRLFLFAAKYLRRFRDSRLYTLFFSGGVLWTFALTVVSFALINLGVFKLDPSQYTVASSHNLLDFAYLAFGAIFFNQVDIITPATTLSRTVFMGEALFGVLLLVIFVSTVVNAQTERYQRELDKAIEVVEGQGAQLATRIKVEFSLSIREAEELLRKAESSLISAILFLSEHTDE